MIAQVVRRDPTGHSSRQFIKHGPVTTPPFAQALSIAGVNPHCRSLSQAGAYPCFSFMVRKGGSEPH